MTKQEKELLTKVLCELFPYGVICRMSGGGFETIKKDKLTAIGLFQFVEEGLECIPYLRPMSSMSEEEILHIQTLVQNKNHELYSRIEECGATGTPDWRLYEISYIKTAEEIDYLNSRHLDHRGLIPMGLALQATEDMYK